MKKITPMLWFDDNAEEAVNHYSSIFTDSKVLEVSRYGEGAPMPAGTVLVIRFQLRGQEFTALNGGPYFKFTEAISFVVECEDQAEVDEFWQKLSAGGEKSQCGWLKDKFGLSWQIVPEILGELMTDKDSEKSGRVMQALMKMNKIDIQALQRAYDG